MHRSIMPATPSRPARARHAIVTGPRPGSGTPSPCACCRRAGASPACAARRRPRPSRASPARRSTSATSPARHRSASASVPSMPWCMRPASCARQRWASCRWKTARQCGGSTSKRLPAADRLAPRMHAGGRILLIGSRTANGAPARSQYAATKAARWAWPAWAAELAPRGITVNVIAPGATDTPFLRDPGRAGAAAPAADRALRRTGRGGRAGVLPAGRVRRRRHRPADRDVRRRLALSAGTPRHRGRPQDSAGAPATPPAPAPSPAPSRRGAAGGTAACPDTTGCLRARAASASQA